MSRGGNAPGMPLEASRMFCRRVTLPSFTACCAARPHRKVCWLPSSRLVVLMRSRRPCVLSSATRLAKSMVMKRSTSRSRPGTSAKLALSGMKYRSPRGLTQSDFGLR